MAVKIDQVDMDLEVTPGVQPRDAQPGLTADDLARIFRSSAFRELLRPIIVSVVGEEIERARKRYG